MEHYLPSVLLSLSPLKSCQWAVVVAQTVLEGGYPENSGSNPVPGNFVKCNENCFEN